MLIALSTGREVGLALVAGTFVAFALLSSLVVPRWRPEYPGRNLRWFVLGTIVLFFCTLGAVEVFAKESEKHKAGEAAPATTTTQTQTQPQAALPKGNPAAGRAVFQAQGCGGCHTFSPAGASGSIGPNLDTALKGKDAAFVRESIVDPNKQIAPGYQPNVMPQDFGTKLSPKQLDDLVAFLLKG